jgi:GTP diphosphokinase / guanosine-3',5'-bis(diphosphate) 3'-diphosphatase
LGTGVYRPRKGLPNLNPAHLLNAIAFAADKHRRQRRKDADRTPYINHPIAVATVLAIEGDVADQETLLCAILHDTVEDTDTNFLELEERFGQKVADLVRELTDDKSLEKSQRKRLQIEHATQASPHAKLVKVADKICNVRDLTITPPRDWPAERRREYLAWSEKVVDGCRGVNPKLDQAFDKAVKVARDMLNLGP